MLVSKLFALLLYGIAYVASLLPLRILYWVSGIFYFIGYYIIGYRKSVIIQNLTRSFPEKKYREIDQIAKDFTRHLFRLFAEWLKLVSASKKSLNKRIHFEHIELLEEAVRNGQSVFLIMGHYGNWEYLNVLPLHVSQPVYAVYKRLRSKLFGYLGYLLRSRFGVKLIESKEALRFVLRHRDTPSVYIFISDQSSSGPVKDTYLFLNQPTSAFSGVEKLASMTGSAIVYVEIMPDKKDQCVISFSSVPSNEQVTVNFLHRLEDSIQKSPEYWLWSHRRWKRTVSLSPQL